MIMAMSRRDPQSFLLQFDVGRVFEMGYAILLISLEIRN
jgi:hypothetical protein